MKHPSITSTDRFLLISFILCITGSLLIYQQINRQYTRSNLVTHSYIIKVTLNQFLLNLTEAETNQRGYLLSHDSDFLNDYQRAIRKARFIVGILDSLTIDDPGQQEGLRKLRQAFNNSMLTLQASMMLPTESFSDPHSDEIIQHTKDVLDNLRGNAYTMLDAEDSLLRNRVVARNNLAKRNPWYMLTTGLLVTSLIFFVYLKLKKETLLRLDSEHNTAELEKKDLLRSRELASLNEQLTTQNNVFLHAEKVALIGSYTWNLSTGQMTFSDNLFRLLGYDPGEFTPSHEHLLRLIHPAERSEILKNTPFLLESIIQTETPCRFITKEGTIRYFRATGKHLYKPDGEVIAGTFQDITKDIELRQALENNDNFIRSLLDIAPSTITIFDLEKSTTVFSSHPQLPTLGHRVDISGPNDNPYSLMHPDDREPAAQYLESLRHLQDREVSEFEYRMKNDEGGYTYFMSRNTPYKANSRHEIIQILGATIDITEKVRAQLEVKAKTEALLRSSFEQQSAIRFKTLADSMPQIVWTADAGGRIDYFNQRWYSYLRLPDKTLSTRDITDNMHPEDVADYFRNWNISVETGNPFQVEFRFRDQNNPGQYCWFLAKALPITDANAVIVKWHGTFTDINDLKLAQLSIQQLVKEKEDFIHIASHELKTPVTSLKGSIQLLERMSGEGALAEEMDVLIEMAVRQVNKLSRMVGDLLDVARMDADKIELVGRDFELQEAIADSLEQVRFLAPGSTIRIDGPTDIRIHSNKERIEQVITNFLSNAIKYSPEGAEIVLEPSLLDGQLRISVTDQGIGIPSSKLPFVFDRFFRVEGSSDKFSGLGLGLYISAGIVSRLRGEIGAVSELGHGSTFWFTLPVNSHAQNGEPQDIIHSAKPSPDWLWQHAPPAS
ncbi:MAG TPA: PAS domain-containing protein [Puia sp.]|jgi:PAS domain S-box-containing protein|nr:PAS domain-containing protein [Puia sp.]